MQKKGLIPKNVNKLINPKSLEHETKFAINILSLVDTLYNMTIIATV